jgi:hypothetical protein
LLVASALAGLSSGEAIAWSGPGHAAVAVMAYRELADEPTLRSALVELLASHPRYAAWKEQYDAAQPTLPSSIDLGAFLFVRASTWPDEIRRTEVLELQRFDHPNWHYVDYPLRPPTFETGPSPTPEDDVLFGIAASNATLADASALPVDRAAALSWLIHLVGDAHQPCHAATLVTEQFPPPGGDQGGNFFWIYQNAAQKNANLKTKMHAYWDGRLGTDWVPDPVEALGNAKMLTAKHPRSTLDELAHGGDVAAWTLESRDAAASHVYRFKGKMLRQKRVLPSGYVTNSHRVARRRLALAGYRLADDLGKTAPTP